MNKLKNVYNINNAQNLPSNDSYIQIDEYN